MYKVSLGVPGPFDTGRGRSIIKYMSSEAAPVETKEKHLEQRIRKGIELSRRFQEKGDFEWAIFHLNNVVPMLRILLRHRANNKSKSI